MHTIGFCYRVSAYYSVSGKVGSRFDVEMDKLNSFRLGEYIFDSEFSSSHLELCNRLTTCVEAILIPYSDNNPLDM